MHTTQRQVCDSQNYVHLTSPQQDTSTIRTHYLTATVRNVCFENLYPVVKVRQVQFYIRSQMFHADASD